MHIEKRHLCKKGLEMKQSENSKPKFNLVFGKHCRSARKALFPELTIEQFASKIPLTGPYLTRIELGQVPVPSATVMAALSDLLGFNPDFLEHLQDGRTHPLLEKLEIDLKDVNSILPSYFLSKDLISAKEESFSISDFLRFFGELCIAASERIHSVSELEIRKPLSIYRILNKILSSNPVFLPLREHAVQSMFLARTRRTRANSHRNA